MYTVRQASSWRQPVRMAYVCVTLHWEFPTSQGLRLPSLLRFHAALVSVTQPGPARHSGGGRRTDQSCSIDAHPNRTQLSSGVDAPRTLAVTRIKMLEAPRIQLFKAVS